MLPKHFCQFQIHLVLSCYKELEINYVHIGYCSYIFLSCSLLLFEVLNRRSIKYVSYNIRLDCIIIFTLLHIFCYKNLKSDFRSTVLCYIYTTILLVNCLHWILYILDLPCYECIKTTDSFNGITVYKTLTHKRQIHVYEHFLLIVLLKDSGIQTTFIDITHTRQNSRRDSKKINF